MTHFIFIYLLLLFPLTCGAFTLNNNIDAGFSDQQVKIHVSANSTCSNAGVSKESLLEMAEDAANKFWNRVPTSNLSLKTVAEGVEDEKSLIHLSGIGCDQAQGYHICKPLPWDKMAEWIEYHQSWKN